MRDRFPLLVLGGLLVLGAAVSFLARGAARGSFADTLSTYRSDSDGARALYLLLSEGGLPVERVQSSFDVLKKNQNLVLLAVEFEEESEGNAEVPLPWFASPDGGTRTAKKDDDEEDPLHKGSNLVRVGRVEASEREKLLDHVREGGTVVYVPWKDLESPFLKAISTRLRKAEPGLGLRTLVPAQPTPFTLHVEKVETAVRAYVELPAHATPLLLDEKLGHVVAGRVPYGQGQVIVIGAPGLAMNESLGRADNAAFWHSLVSRVAQSGPVAFDEFHHGFKNERSIAEFAARYGLQYAALQLLLGIGAWALALRRFGPVRAFLEDKRMGSTDALSATSRLYREGGHHRHAAGVIVQQLAHDLASVAGTSVHAKPSEVVGALAARGFQKHATALTQVTQRAAIASSEADVLAVAQRAAALRLEAHPPHAARIHS